MKKIRRTLTTVINITVFAVCLFVLICSIISMQSGVPMISGFGVMNVYTESMEPTYMTGDLLIIKKTDADLLNVGDVISFYSRDPKIFGIPNTHRIESIDNSGGQFVFTTKGDNNPAPDEFKVNESDIIGKVQFRIPFIGKAVKLLQTNNALFFVIIVLPLIVIMAFEIRNVVIKSREVVEEKHNEDQ